MGLRLQVWTRTSNQTSASGMPMELSRRGHRMQIDLPPRRIKCRIIKGLHIDSTPGNYKRIPITDLKKPKFLDYPISNFDIINWVKYFKIKNFNGVFSRDNLKETIKKPECAIINLDDSIGSETHWVC